MNNNEAWSILFDKYDIKRKIEEDGFFRISADRIKEYREPRLMAKFDHAKNRPRLFSENNLSILPVSRGMYEISRFNAYHCFEEQTSPIEKAVLPEHLRTLTAGGVFSEAVALNCAAASGIIADFTGEEDLVPTVSGRMGSGTFSFRIGNTVGGGTRTVAVDNAQIEIDAAYEGRRSLVLFEAKTDLSDDFLVRQLYYPFRAWRNRAGKDVRTVFLVYSDGVYRMFEYAFDTPERYDSLRLVQQKKYSVEDAAVSVSDMLAVWKNAVIVSEPDVPFPQADSLDRVVNLCELLAVRDMNKQEITERYDFDVRQTGYYTDAARYLGLLEKRSGKGGTVYALTETGRRIFSSGYRARRLALCGLVLAHKPFHIAAGLYFRTGRIPEKREIFNALKTFPLYKVDSDSTRFRRCSTVKRWLERIVASAS